MRDLPDDDSWIPERRQTIGATVRRLREERQLTQEQVHLAARISRYTLQRVEAGEESKVGTLLRIAFVLNVPLADLVRDWPGRPGSPDQGRNARVQVPTR